MRIGILSDTHDRVSAMKAAIQLLRENGAEFYIHCGDVGSERVLDHLAGLQSAFVWGNNDWDRPHLDRYAAKLGIACHGNLAELELGGKRFAVIHGDDFRLKDRILSEQKHDYLLQGHTHIRSDQKVGTIRCINPGALYRAAVKTVALLDTETDTLKFVTVNGV
jgi:hypothetical protein